jgi:RNA recognition motif-containing protein
VGYTIHISNLPFTSNEDDIREFLVGCGTIKRISIVRDDSGSSKGYGFVEFETENGMKRAIMKNNAILSKRNLLIKESKRKITEKKKTTHSQHFAEPDQLIPKSKQLKIENKAQLSNKDFKSLFMAK